MPKPKPGYSVEREYHKQEKNANARNNRKCKCKDARKASNPSKPRTFAMHQQAQPLQSASLQSLYVQYRDRLR
jgi:hypothetical protein